VPLATLLVNVASLSSILGAVAALTVLAVLRRSRGAFLLLAAVLCLAADYAVGLILYAPQGSPLWRGLAGSAAVRRWELTLLGVKGLLHVVMLVTGPLAAYSLTGGWPARGTLRAGMGLAAAFSAALALLMGGLLPPSLLFVFILGAAPAYLTYAACFAVLLGGPAQHLRPGLPRATRMAALVALGVFTPALIAADIAGLVGGAGPLPVSPAAFVVLTAGILVFSILALSGGGRTAPAAGDIDRFCADNLLSVREREVLLLLCQGKRYKQIAESLCVSLDTVKSHVSRIYRKTSASGKTDLIYRIKG
jgi:DNA-binding CsgD family transcriptional regulator